ncbi:hypothetical protein GCM10017778_29330 [Streptomyces vinaceus]|nr:hypothetical protein GCM10017778_29330 [Streptomyces vinaceus]
MGWEQLARFRPVREGVRIRTAAPRPIGLSDADTGIHDALFDPRAAADLRFEPCRPATAAATVTLPTGSRAPPQLSPCGRQNEVPPPTRGVTPLRTSRRRATRPVP